MKVREGDVLVCSCGDCNIELQVTKACTPDVCGHDVECEIDAECCGSPMTVKH